MQNPFFRGVCSVKPYRHKPSLPTSLMVTDEPARFETVMGRQSQQNIFLHQLQPCTCVGRPWSMMMLHGRALGVALCCLAFIGSALCGCLEDFERGPFGPEAKDIPMFPRALSKAPGVVHAEVHRSTCGITA